MKIRILLLSILVLTSLSGCGVARGISAVIPVAPSVPFRILSSQAHFSGMPAQNHVFLSQADVDKFLAGVEPSQSDGSGNPIRDTLPTIDFGHEQGVLVLFGGQPDTGYSGSIAAIEEKGDRLLVHPVRWTPAGIGGYGQMIVFPYQFVALSRSDKPIDFAPTIDKASPTAWWLLFW